MDFVQMFSLVLTASKDAEDKPGAVCSVVVPQACHPSTGEVEATGKGFKVSLSHGLPGTLLQKKSKAYALNYNSTVPVG